MTFVSSRYTHFSCLPYSFSLCFPQTRLHPYADPQGRKDGRTYQETLLLLLLLLLLVFSPWAGLGRDQSSVRCLE